MSTLEETTMHPRYILEWFHLFGTSLYISQNLILNLKRKQVKQNTSRNSISSTWMISSFWHKSKYKSKFNFELKKKTRQTKYKSKFNFKFFWKKKFMFPCCSTREDLSIDVSIGIVGLILANLGWFQLFGTSRNSISNFFEKKISILGFICCSTREGLSIDVSITNVGLILTKLWWFLFSGCGQMDRRTERQTDGQTRFWNPHMETCRHTKNFNLKLKISG